MEVGSIVVTISDFETVRKIWGFNYPKKGDVLTVSNILPHRNVELAKKGICLLFFVELPNLIGVCDKKYNGILNFEELLLSEEISEILNEKTLTKCI